MAKPGAVAQPGWLKSDQLAEILLDSKAMSSPAMAIKEMRSALGHTEMMINGVKTNVNVFDAVARSVLDDKIRMATRYISGSVKLASGGQTLWRTNFTMDSRNGRLWGAKLPTSNAVGNNWNSAIQCSYFRCRENENDIWNGGIRKKQGRGHDGNSW